MIHVVSSEEAVRLLSEGHVVAVPTDTVYGLAASLEYPRAIERLFEIKRRPLTLALPVIIESFGAFEKLDVNWPEQAQRLSDAFWPGALTVVVAVPHELADLVGSSHDTAGFRIPNDELLLDVARRVGPLAVSSANEHGDEPCHSAADVVTDFAQRDGVDGVLDGGVRSGEVSTVVEISDSTWRVLRSGAIKEDELARVLN